MNCDKAGLIDELNQSNEKEEEEEELMKA